MGNCRPVSILSSFSKIPERIIKNRIFLYFTENEILYKNNSVLEKETQLNMQKFNWLIKLNNFEKNHFDLGDFIDLSKTFDTVDQHILIKKLNQYGVKGNNIR